MEKLFWKDIKKQIIASSTLEYQNDTRDVDEKILKDILNYYGEEMTPNFKVKSYRFVQNVLPPVYVRLMSPLKELFFNFFSSKMNFFRKMKLFQFKIRNQMTTYIFLRSKSQAK